MTVQKNIAKKIFLILWLRKNCRGKIKINYLINQMMPCRVLHTLKFTEAAVLRYSTGNFQKLFEAHPWQKTILVKLLLHPLYRARLNEGTAMCIRSAVFKKRLLLVLNLTINRYKDRCKLPNGVFQQISKYFFLCQSTPAVQLVLSL